MADRDGDKRQEQITQNTGTPDMGLEGDGPVTPGRAGAGMGVSVGDYTDVPPPPQSTSDGPATTVTVGEDTGQRRDLPDQHATPPTPKDNAGKRARSREEGEQG